MITLTDGPAAGDYESNQAPRHLRAVVDREGQKSILDDPEERPEEPDTLHIYRRDGRPFTANICGRGRTGAVVRIARYSLLEGQDTRLLRDPQAWRDWCGEREGAAAQEE